MAKRDNKFRAWCFTANISNDWGTPTNDCLQTRWVNNWADQHIAYRYVCMQLEIAPTTGQRHYQGYVYFTNPVRFSSVTTGLDAFFQVTGVHVTKCDGTADQNYDYCSKSDSAVEGTFWELGERPKQGRRSDLQAVAEMIDDGNDLVAVARSYPSQFIRYGRGIKDYLALTTIAPRDPSVEPTVVWYYGPTGVGKSKLAYEKWPDAYRKMTGNKWWDGYHGQKEVIFDDYRAGMCPFNELLKIIDRYPHRIEIKGDSCNLSATCFVFTTCKRPEVIWHSRTDEDLHQLLRRITHIYELTADQVITMKDENTEYVPLSHEEIATFVRPTDEHDHTNF